jgi:hypothetical protein
MIQVEYYTKNKKVYHYEPTEAERAEIDEMKTRQKNGRRYAEKLAREKYCTEHSQGYCDKCFMLKPLTGICPNCN